MRRLIVLASLAAVAPAAAHPGSGIGVAGGEVYFVDTGKGVRKIDGAGRLGRHPGPAFHWMTLDPSDRFASAPLPQLPGSEVTASGRSPTVLLSSDFPIIIGRDGALVYPDATGGSVRLMHRLPSGAQRALATGAVRWVNGLAVGADGAIYFSEDAAVRKVARAGAVETVVGDVAVKDCARVPGSEKLPYLRGLDVAPDGTVYVAASGCGAVLRISPRGEVAAVLRAEAPWSPTGIAIDAGAVHVLEYLHTEGDDRRQWFPRVRKIAADGKVTTLVTIDAANR